MKNKFRQLDICSMPLEGMNLIEAGAGTGKTYAIANLYLRLVIEKRLSVREILVVTFTEAATKELRDRIRRNLSRAAAAIQDPDACGDEAVRRIVRQGGGGDPVALLHRALISFDEAAIFTIHGFCAGILNDYAYECAVPFNTELVADQRDVSREIVDDFWRTHFSTGHALFPLTARKKGLSPDDLMRLADERIRKPLLVVVPEAVAVSRTELERRFDALGAEWRRSAGEIESILMNDPALRRSANTYHRDATRKMLDALEAAFSGTPDGFFYDAVYKASTPVLNDPANLLKRKGAPAPHVFFDRCGEFTQIADRYALAVRHAFLDRLGEELDARKRRLNIRSFDDLLLNVRKALRADGGDFLADAVRRKFRAAMIDEFQDTDPVQYDIFKTIFSGAHGLFLIGDPKQSIYGFRGADIFAYITAVRDTAAGKGHTLLTNWRSESRLVEAVNRVFNRMANPFVLGSAIAFRDAASTPKSKGNETPLGGDGDIQAGLVLGFLKRIPPDTKKGGGPNKEQALETAFDWCAAEIRRLVEEGRAGRITIGANGLQPSDIAVLVTRNLDAQAMKDRLNRLRIPAVLTRSGNVFRTREAGELEHLLLAAASPGDAMRLNAALASRMTGFSGEAIRAMLEDGEQLEQYEQHVERFHRYHELWIARGFMAMFRRLASDYDLRAWLFGLPDGERLLTNTLHIVELIHTAAVERKLGINGVLNWLVERRTAEDEKEEEELRLESDEDAVQILTVFKSKGLEYPVVFCPSMWARGAVLGRDARSCRLYHRDNDFIMDIGSDEWDRAGALEEKERLAELVRLLYVAVTRARSRCYVALGLIGKPAATALDYMMCGGDGTDDDRIVTRLIERRGVSEEEWETRAREYFNDDGGRILLHSAACPEEVRPVSGFGAIDMDLAPKTFSSRAIPDRAWSIASYSALTAGERHEMAIPDKADQRRDEAETAAATPVEVSPGGFFAFPRGAVPGTCIHTIFEELDFGLDDENHIRDVIRRNLDAFGLSAALRTGTDPVNPVDAVHDMVRRVLQVPLADQPPMRLSAIPAGERITEMEFYYPLCGLGAEELRRIFALNGERAYSPSDYPERIGRLAFRPVTGFMHGFIDLVFRFEDRFYILDWKTNYLGPGYDFYTGEHLRKAMADAHYLLQIMVYSLALDRYLRQRLPGYDYDRHFGGAYYLFLRGVHPDRPGCGIYFQRPAREAVAEFSGFCKAGQADRQWNR